MTADGPKQGGLTWTLSSILTENLVQVWRRRSLALCACVCVCLCVCGTHVNDEFSLLKVTSEDSSISLSMSPITCFSAPLMPLHHTSIPPHTETHMHVLASNNDSIYTLIYSVDRDVVIFTVLLFTSFPLLLLLLIFYSCHSPASTPSFSSFFFFFSTSDIFFLLLLLFLLFFPFLLLLPLFSFRFRPFLLYDPACDCPLSLVPPISAAARSNCRSDYKMLAL